MLGAKPFSCFAALRIWAFDRVGYRSLGMCACLQHICAVVDKSPVGYYRPEKTKSEEPESSNVNESGLPTEQPTQHPVLKRRKRHRRKHFENQNRANERHPTLHNPPPPVTSDTLIAPHSLSTILFLPFYDDKVSLNMGHDNGSLLRAYSNYPIMGINTKGKMMREWGTREGREWEEGKEEGGGDEVGGEGRRKRKEESKNTPCLWLYQKTIFRKDVYTDDANQKFYLGLTCFLGPKDLDYEDQTSTNVRYDVITAYGVYTSLAITHKKKVDIDFHVTGSVLKEDRRRSKGNQDKKKKRCMEQWLLSKSNWRRPGEKQEETNALVKLLVGEGVDWTGHCRG
ncbi:hypothetical protein Tco_0345581 [Tanacetum coccineum]